MRRVTLAARRAQRYIRRPPQPRWLRPALVGAGSLLGGALLGGGLWGAVEAGLFARAGEAVSARLLDWTAGGGLVVQEVYVDGRVRTDPEALRRAIGVARGEPLLAVDPDALRARVEALTWVGQASVTRRFPDALRISLFERQPLALWQRDGAFRLIDRTGAVIEGALDDPPDLGRYGDLRVLVGEGAPAHAARLFALLSTEPALWRRVVAATWVGGRRWSLRFDNGIDVLLPEDGVPEAWRLLAAMEREERLLERAITVVDLRFLPERMRVRLDPAVLERRGA